MSVKLKMFDYLPHCLPCLECCRGENVYTTPAEVVHFGEKVGDGPCHHLMSDGRCDIHSMRPMECRMYPLDVKRLDGELTWIVWESCPAAPHVPVDELEAQVVDHERTMSIDYFTAYVDHHEKNEPAKYSAMSFRKLRKLSTSK